MNNMKLIIVISKKKEEKRKKKITSLYESVLEAQVPENKPPEKPR